MRLLGIIFCYSSYIARYNTGLYNVCRQDNWPGPSLGCCLGCCIFSFRFVAAATFDNRVSRFVNFSPADLTACVDGRARKTPETDGQTDRQSCRRRPRSIQAA